MSCEEFQTLSTWGLTYCGILTVVVAGQSAFILYVFGPFLWEEAKRFVENILRPQ